MAEELTWETIEELFALSPFVRPPVALPTVDQYTRHFLALQLRYLTIPIGGRIDPFWFQMQNVRSLLEHHQSMTADRTGTMIADEPGLGKTISAGMFIKELLARRQASSVLIVCPSSVVPQWQAEMLDKLDEAFTVVSEPRGTDWWSQAGQKRMIDWAHDRGVKTHLHSCGNVMELIPEFVEIGLDALNPLEQKAGMDALTIKRQYGDKLVLEGGIDVRNMTDGQKIEEEIRTKLPLLKENGGYIFHSDHSVPENVSFADFCRVQALARWYGRY